MRAGKTSSSNKNLSESKVGIIQGNPTEQLQQESELADKTLEQKQGGAQAVIPQRSIERQANLLRQQNLVQRISNWWDSMNSRKPTTGRKGNPPPPPQTQEVMIGGIKIKLLDETHLIPQVSIQSEPSILKTEQANPKEDKWLQVKS